MTQHIGLHGEPTIFCNGLDMLRHVERMLHAYTGGKLFTHWLITQHSHRECMNMLKILGNKVGKIPINHELFSRTLDETSTPTQLG